VDLLSGDASLKLEDVLMKKVLMGEGNRPISPKTPQQSAYTEAIRNHDIVFGVGPAGTGKTYLAMAMAVAALQKKEVKKIILTRPAVEAGEKLGYLPGDLMEKVNPYVRPLYDALHEMMDVERAHRLVEDGVIEVAPLAFMRGRTLNHAFVILDEAQNSTRQQMKMFLTRLGHSAKAVITGDVTQVDLPLNQQSGLLHATRILRGVRGVEVVSFTTKDVVRHPLVARIIRAYEKEEEERGTSRAVREKHQWEKNNP
jgi:phosphate starvation-inducible PhoH-like protein